MTSSQRLGHSARSLNPLLFSRRIVAQALAAATLTAGAALGPLPPTGQAAPRAAEARAGDGRSPREGRRQGAASLAGALDEGGGLRPGVGGSFDTSGFRMGLSPAGAPRFVAEPACSGWDTQFSVPNGVDGAVSALAVSGTDIYVGGSFKTTSTSAANSVAKFDTTTNIWSKLGTDGAGCHSTFLVSTPWR